MGEILGVGVTHYPPLMSPDEDRRFPLNFTLQRDERVPEEMKKPSSWPEAMRIEYGEYQGLASAAEPQELLIWAFLLGAMNELGSNPEIIDWIETHVFTSDKCPAIFKP